MVVITMENGKQIKLQLEPDKAPGTVKNFEKLMQAVPVAQPYRP